MDFLTTAVPKRQGATVSGSFPGTVSALTLVGFTCFSPVFAFAQKQSAPPTVDSAATSGTVLKTATKFTARLILDENDSGPVAYRGFPLVQLRINGSDPLYFVLDSGTPDGIHLYPWAAKELNLIKEEDSLQNEDRAILPVKKATLLGKTGAEFELTGIARGLGITTRLRTSGLTQEAKAAKLAGIVGIDFFARHTVCFDPAAKELRLFASSEKPFHLPGADVVTLLPHADSLASQDPKDSRRDVEVTFPGMGKMKLLFSTASTSMEVAVNRARFITDLSVSDRSAPVKTPQGIESTYLALVPQITVGTRTEPNVPIVLTRTDPPGSLSKFGSTMLSRFRTTIDYAHNQMLLEPSLEYRNQTALPGDIGLEFEKPEDKLLVSDLDKDRPAWNAGVRPGDFVLAIDGVDVTKSDPDTAMRRLPRRLGDTVSLKLQHSDSKAETFEVKVTTGSWFRPVVKKKLFGFRQQISVNPGTDTIQAMGISEVLPNSAAALAGLKVGDSILFINDKPVTTLTVSALNSVMLSSTEESPVRMTVSRPGVSGPVKVKLTPQVQSILDLLDWGSPPPKSDL